MHRGKSITVLALSLAALPTRAMYGFQAPETFFHRWDATWSGQQVLVKDANGDGLDDVLLTNMGGPDVFHRQVELLVLVQDPTTHRLSAPIKYPVTPLEWNTSAVSSLAQADINGDGTDDILIGHTDGVTVLDPTHGYAISSVIEDRGGFSYLYPKIARVGDLDGDGDLDIAVLTVPSESPSRLVVYRGDGAGHFDNGSELFLPDACCFRDLRVQDINGDTRPDLLLNLQKTNSSYDGPFGIWAYYNLGGGAFGATPTSLVAGGGGYWPGMAVGDIDGDGRPDLATAYSDYRSSQALAAMRVYLHGSAGAPYRLFRQWPPNISSSPGADAIVDMNRDGKQDLLFRDGGYFDPESSQTICFESYVPSGGRYAYRYPADCAPTDNKIAIGDINGDGLLDIVNASDFFGVGWMLGTNYPDIVNLVSGAGLSPGTVAFNIKNASTTKTIASPAVVVKLSVSHGSFKITDIPAACEMQYPYTDTMSCTYSDLAPGASAAGVVHYTMTKTMPMARLTATATATTPTQETLLVDNSATVATWLK